MRLQDVNNIKFGKHINTNLIVYDQCPSYWNISKISLLLFICLFLQIGVTSTINDTWVNGTLINEGDKRVHAKIDAMRS